MTVNRKAKREEQKLNSPDGSRDFNPDPFYLTSMKKLASIRLA